jgi:endo-1,4-beta-xylanase
MKKIIVSIALLILSTQCAKDDSFISENEVKANESNRVVVPAECTALRLKNLANAANNSNFPIGIQFSANQVTRTTEPYLTTEIDRRTIYFSMYDILKGPTTYDFAAIDNLITYTQGKGLSIHGHGLIYPLNTNGTPNIYVSPSFMINYPNITQADKDNFKKIIMDYITATVTHFKGKISGYDLMNEMFDHTGVMDQTTWLRKRFATDIEYIDFIGECFVTANAADPTATFLYNDYNQENLMNGVYTKGNNIKAMIDRWLLNGVPIKGYGLQFHTYVGKQKSEMVAALQLASSTGLKIHVSELDVSVNPGNNLTRTALTAQMLQNQKATFKSVVEAYKQAVPAAQQYGITMWDASDKYTWFVTNNIRSFEAPTLYDTANARKPAYYGFAEGLSGVLYPTCGQ